MHYFEFTGSKSGEIDGKVIHPSKEENMTDLGHFLVVKWHQIQHATLSVLFLMGLASTLVRYLKKIVHRLSVDSPQFYDISFWV